MKPFKRKLAQVNTNLIRTTYKNCKKASEEEADHLQNEHPLQHTCPNKAPLPTHVSLKPSILA
ncbi:hypothetical protein CASFOL_017798 [Castilleja foliolosa]|uniref:Uncharacterized protein n=1 Tax=Castilleja foliolosa TaxID=1961234 RepID=A0ABD3D8U4_9LAMI